MFEKGFGGWKDRRSNSENEPIDADIINGVYVDVEHVIRDANVETRTAAYRRTKGIRHSCPNCPPQFKRALDNN